MHSASPPLHNSSVEPSGDVRRHARGRGGCSLQGRVREEALTRRSRRRGEGSLRALMDGGEKRLLTMSVASRRLKQRAPTRVSS
ncbi:hypothetical protein PBY51_018551 [Eleginops maclovinus]|uniref:Uncharacterized protein n=1 Tax=Eleginops maclovinus TaxID=56733 RepID=A0AAN7Y3Q8_ELEMC|nr:hypothetical protein PBY51_018551 [Eleginops maclovinus]